MLQHPTSQIGITCYMLWYWLSVNGYKRSERETGNTKSEKKESYWKRRIENNIKKWIQDLRKMTEVRYCRAKLGEEERERMGRSYELSDRGTIHVINVLKQIITTAGAKICRYNQRNLQYHQNNLFRNDQRKFYKRLDGKIMDRLRHQIQRDQLSFGVSYGLNQWSTIEIQCC